MTTVGVKALSQTDVVWTGFRQRGISLLMDKTQGAAAGRYDVAVIGAGPAGVQAAVSAWHQGREVLVLDAGEVSNRKGRAYWSKSVPIEDAPGLPPTTGPQLRRILHGLLRSHPPGDGEPGITLQGAYVLDVEAAEGGFSITASLGPQRDGKPIRQGTFHARAIVVASGFEDGWPAIEDEQDKDRLHERYRTVFRYAGNRRGWHLCIRCDGHLHRGGHFVLLGVGEAIYEAALGAQDFTDQITIVTNGRPVDLPDAMLAQAEARDIRIDERPIRRHVGKGTMLEGVEFEDGEILAADGFLVDEGLEANVAFLRRFSLRRTAEGLLVVGEDSQILRDDGTPIPGLYAAGDLVAGQRKLIATAMASGQDAGLAASDSLRRWRMPD